jgi:hypothetical protein
MTGPEPLSSSTWLLVAVFGLSGIYGVIGHLALYLMVKGRVKTVRLLANTPFYAVARYFAQDPSYRSRILDVYAITVAASVPILILSFVLLYPRIWS